MQKFTILAAAVLLSFAIVVGCAIAAAVVLIGPRLPSTPLLMLFATGVFGIASVFGELFR